MHMRRLKRMVLAVGAAMVMLMGLAGPAGAEPNENARGRGASTGGLTQAQLANVDLQNTKPLEQVTLNFVRSQNPEQPGVTPGSGGGGCTTC